MRSGQHIIYSIDDFLKLSKDQFSGVLKDRSTQTNTWDEEFDHIQKVLTKLQKHGYIIFEYGIPSLNFVIDVVLLIEGKVFVIEYKCGDSATAYSPEHLQQVRNYALRLKYFHDRSNERWIIPILVAMNAPDREIPMNKTDDIQLWDTVSCNKDTLCEAISRICIEKDDNGNDDWASDWANGIYKATPTIIKAACDMWERNNVSELNKSEADNDTKLSAEEYVLEIVERTKKCRGKAIVFITGVPGAGKTLVGLSLSVKCQMYGASMLSGNDPLVKVLSTALRKDLEKQYKSGKLKDEVRERYEAARKKAQEEKELEKNKISIDAVIRTAYSYKQEIILNRLCWEDGSYALKEGANRGSQHVIIFDEAQRAWTKTKMRTPGQSGKKDWQKRQDWPFSEPGLLLWDMNQRDWGVFVCLVGGGQEINTGEAGIGEWLMSLNSRAEFNDWNIYMAEDLNNPIYQRATQEGKTLNDYAKLFEKSGRLHKDSRLHLQESMRSIRNKKVSDFIENILSCNVEVASQLYKEIESTYRIYLTRDINKAKNYLRNCLSQHGQMEEDVRIGMLMSSKAARLRPLGYEVKKVADYLSKVSDWFLDPSNYTSSSNFLEVALSEFFVQGLELDFAAVMWDGDFRYNSKKGDWDYFNFDGKKEWARIDKSAEAQEMKRLYMKNAYRVLLTRARAGMVICVPQGDPIDQTRKPEIYEGTYKFLRSIGIKELE